jgi:P-type Cu2+ transporter
MTQSAFLAPAVVSQSRATCAHCGQSVPSAAVEPDSAPQFCCSGCRSVFAILHESGLDDYYAHRSASGADVRAAATTGRAYSELDEPEFTKLYCRAAGTGVLGTELYLEGIHCSACVWLVEKVTQVLPGIAEARLDVSRGILRVAWDPSRVKLSEIAAKLDAFGYPCHPLHGLDKDAVRRREDRALLMRMGVAGACAGNTMMLAIALYSGALQGMQADLVQLFRWGSVVVALPSILWSAGVFYKGALGALRTLTPHMDLPISLGIVVGTVSGVVNIVHSHGEIYFDTLTMLVFLLLAGRYVQQRKQRGADSAAELLGALAPSTARLVEGSTVREVPVETVPIDALVEIRAGEHVPVDGVIVEGTSSLDASLLTGESLPEDVAPGAAVHAGCVNLSSRLVVRAEKTGQSTRVARLVASVEEAAARRAPVVVAANRLSGYFVLTILAVTAVTVAAWWHVDPSKALDRAVALLVVTCPCALALATPLAVSAALGRAAGSGLLVKGGEFLEALARPGLVVFDKTGTLTMGKLALVGWAGDEDVKPLVAIAESASAHPIARTLATALSAPDGERPESLHETLGGGIDATVRGHRVTVGSRAFVTSRVRQLPEWVTERSSAVAESGCTPVLVAVDGAVRAVASLGDPVRPEAKESLEELLRLGYRIAVLSGDQTAVVRAVVAQIGVPFEEVRGDASPEAKLAFIEERAAKGPVFMVGDGVNDASALSAATVGIAVHGGAEASLAAADVFATKSGLAPVVELVHGARRTLRIIRTSLARSLVYNLTVGTLAAAGFVGPLLAAVLMPVSSISVIVASYRSRTFGGAR